MSLRDLIRQAESDLHTFKSPDVSEVKARLNELIVAAKMGSIEHDKLESLSISENNLTIVTAWSTRGCINTMDFEIPLWVIDHKDPIKAIKVWAKQVVIAKRESQVATAEANLRWAKAQLALAKDAIY